jgi:hypothetical protein
MLKIQNSHPMLRHVGVQLIVKPQYMLPIQVFLQIKVMQYLQKVKFLPKTVILQIIPGLTVEPYMDSITYF